MRAALYRPWARSQSSLAWAASDLARFRSASEVFNAASPATASVSAACTDASGVDIGRGLHVLKLCQQLPLLHAVAFLDVKLDDLAEGVGSDVYVGLWLDFTGSTDHRGEVLLLHFSALYRHQVFPALVNSDS